MNQRLKVEGQQDAKRRISKDEFLIESLKVVVNGIAETFGPRCEVVLHDLRNLKKLDHSIVEIANGHVTGRTIGGSITDQGLRYFRGGGKDDFVANYASLTKDGSPLKSSTMTFKNDKGKPIAAICVNLDVTDIVNFNMVIQDMFKVTEKPQQNEPMETFEEDIVSTLTDIADKVIRGMAKAIPSMKRGDKVEVVRQLENQGFFLIKGAIKLLAGKLNVSKFTIYNYLQRIRAENRKEQIQTNRKNLDGQTSRH